MDLLQVSLNRTILGTLLENPNITEVMVIRTLARYITAREMEAVVNELGLEGGW